MNSQKLDLLDGEGIIFQSGRAQLTNRRLFTGKDVAYLNEITDVKKMSGGQESLIKQGFVLATVGVLFSLLEVILSPNLTELIDTMFFIAGSLGIVSGLYLLVRSLVRVRPHTTIFFRVEENRDISISFQGQNNPEADELIRQYSRARKDL